MAADQHRRALAEEIAVLAGLKPPKPPAAVIVKGCRFDNSGDGQGIHIPPSGPPEGRDEVRLQRVLRANLPAILEALSGREVEAMRADDHRIKALIAEARERAFRRDLAERTCQSERERWLRVGKKALAGDLRALARQIAVTENPPRIVGSGAAGPALPQEGRSDG